MKTIPHVSHRRPERHGDLEDDVDFDSLRTEKRNTTLKVVEVVFVLITPQNSELLLQQKKRESC